MNETETAFLNIFYFCPYIVACDAYLKKWKTKWKIIKII